MKRFFCILALVALSASCANLSKNRVVEGTVVLVGGVSGDRTWRDHWTFRRYSWVHELTMWLDVPVAEITPDSPFFSWASEDEKKLISSCRRFRVVMAYSLDSRKISEKDMLAQFDRQGHHEVMVPRLIASVRLHPDFDRLGLDRHRVHGLCQKGPDLPIVLDFPAFAPVTLP